MLTYYMNYYKINIFNQKANITQNELAAKSLKIDTKKKKQKTK